MGANPREGRGTRVDHKDNMWTLSVRPFYCRQGHFACRACMHAWRWCGELHRCEAHTARVKVFEYDPFLYTRWNDDKYLWVHVSCIIVKHIARCTLKCVCRCVRAHNVSSVVHEALCVFSAIRVWAFYTLNLYHQEDMSGIAFRS